MNVTMSEAIRRLGVSRSTVKRWLRDGRLTGQKEAGRWVITLPDEPGGGQDEPRTGRVATDLPPAQQVAILTQKVADLEGERDYLRNALAAALSPQRLLAERSEPPPKRGLWQRIRTFFVGQPPEG